MPAIGRKRPWLQNARLIPKTKHSLSQNLPRIPQNACKEIPKIPFAKFAEIWLKTHAETSLKRSTLARYRDIIFRVFIPAIGAIPLCRLKAFHIHALAADRLKVVSPKTAADELGLIKQMLGCARRWGYIESDPSEPIKAAEKRQRRDRDSESRRDRQAHRRHRPPLPSGDAHVRLDRHAGRRIMGLAMAGHRLRNSPDSCQAFALARRVSVAQVQKLGEADRHTRTAGKRTEKMETRFLSERDRSGVSERRRQTGLP